MKHDLPVTNGIIISHHELEITASRAGGPGGQHVNKTSSRITVRWNIKNSSALTDEQKERVLLKLGSQVTEEGDILVHNSSTRSQHQNRELALKSLANRIKKALYVSKKRVKTEIPASIQESRLKAKTRRSEIKKMRSKKIDY